MPVDVIYERLNIYTLAFPYCLTKSFISLHIMNGLVLCTGANKTVGSLEFSKMRLQALVKSRKGEQLLPKWEQEHSATGDEAIGVSKWQCKIDHKILVFSGRNAKPHDRYIGMQRTTPFVENINHNMLLY